MWTSAESRQVGLPQKGLPYPASANPGQAIPGGWNVLREDLQFPVLVLKESSLANNIRSMQVWCKETDIDLAPHGKTTMCPQIFQRQMAAGAWGITVATVPQALVCLRTGIKRILIANQIVGMANISSFAAALHEDDDTEIYCLADSVEGIEHLACG